MPSVHHVRRALYICASCTRSLQNGLRHPPTRVAAAARLSHPPPNTYSSSNTYSSTNAYSTTSPAMAKKPMRLAIVGSGPAGFYTAHRLMKHLPDAVVDMYEKLPVPYGLVRFGVAPDHPEVKNCQNTFEQVAASERFTYVGNVEVGKTLALADMKPHYDAIMFAYGASEDRKLGIPGEDTYSGVYSAREFVGWYNGHPDFSHLNPTLDMGEHAVVVGQGNVALDVARILVKPLDQLRRTDIAEHALAALSRSMIKRVEIVGRRGPLQAAFTVKEARELMHFPNVGFKSDAKSFYPHDLGILPRAQKRIADILIGGSLCNKKDHKKRWQLSFLKSPVAILPSRKAPDHVGSIMLQRNAFAPNTDRLSKDAKVVPTDENVQSPASVVFRSVGYKSAALPGLEHLGIVFDDKLGVIPNDAYGRILSPSKGPGPLSAAHLPGLYAVGWVKRGPTGVIVSTMMDAFTTSDAIVQDWKSDAQFLNTEKGVNKSTSLGWDGVKNKVLAQGVVPVNWAAWKRIDMEEREKGKTLNKKREKFTSFEQMMIAAGIA